jgi:hypothetical protein
MPALTRHHRAGAGARHAAAPVLTLRRARLLLRTVLRDAVVRRVGWRTRVAGALGVYPAVTLSAKSRPGAASVQQNRAIILAGGRPPQTAPDVTAVTG